MRSIATYTQGETITNKLCITAYLQLFLTIL